MGGDGLGREFIGAVHSLQEESWGASAGLGWGVKQAEGKWPGLAKWQSAALARAQGGETLRTEPEEAATRQPMG